MKAATLHQIKKELETSSPKRIMDLTLRLIKYKTENKELISYLLFDEDDLAGYIADLRDEVSVMFDDIHPFPPYQTKRGRQKSTKIYIKIFQIHQCKRNRIRIASSPLQFDEAKWNDTK
jgi:hypothetical protein